MAVPKRKISKHRRGNRRSHHALTAPNLRPCPNCKEFGLPHKMCTACGYYNGRLILAPKVKKVKEKKEES